MIGKLSAIYNSHDVTPYKREGQIYPFIASHTDIATPLNAILAPQRPQTTRTRDELPIYHEGLVPGILAQGKRLYNGVTFTFERLEHEPLQLHAQLGRYFDHIATCVALENELATGPPYPLRDKLHAHISPAELMTSGAGRSAALGVGTLTVFNSPEGYKLLLVERSASTAHKAGSLHVVPAFIFQPSGDDYPAQEWSLTHQIKREYVEELFDADEMETDGADFTETPQAQHLEAMLADERASLHFTGIAMNLLTTQVVICSLLLIHDAAWFQEDMGGAWEVSGLYTAPITTDAALLAALPPGTPTRLTPAGAAALWLGLDRARALLV